MDSVEGVSERNAAAYLDGIQPNRVTEYWESCHHTWDCIQKNMPWSRALLPVCFEEENQAQHETGGCNHLPRCSRGDVVRPIKELALQPRGQDSAFLYFVQNLYETFRLSFLLLYQN
jgi:hypothetical protein